MLNNISIYPRLDAIATDAELEDRPQEDLSRLADILHNGCVRAVAEYEEKLKEDPNFDGNLYTVFPNLTYLFPVSLFYFMHTSHNRQFSRRQ